MTKVRLEVLNPDSIQFELTLRMSLGEWKQLRDQLQSTYPSWKLSSAIYEMVTKADKHFATDVED